MTGPWRSRMARVARATPVRVKELALTVGAVGGLACILFALAALGFGLTPLVVQSGSMEPTVSAGSLLVNETTPAADLRRGDIVTVRRVDRTLVTHRIVHITHRGDSATLRLKGDANDAVDGEIYTVKEAGTKVFVVPYAGWIAAWASSALGLFLLGLYVAFLLVTVVVDWRERSERSDRGDHDDSAEEPSVAAAKRVRGGKRKASRRATAASLSVVMLGSLGAVSAPTIAPQPTMAAWTDTATAGTSTLTAYTVPTPANFRCGALGILSVTFLWDAVPGATNYTLHHGIGGALTTTVTGTSHTVVAAISGGTAWVTANRNFGSTTWTSGASNTRGYTVAVVSLCG